MQKMAWIVLWAGCVGTLVAQELQVEQLSGPPSSKRLSPEIVKLLAPQGWKLVRNGRSYMSLWLVKSLQLRSSGEVPEGEVLYPLQPGSVVGVVRLYRTTPDFRGQELRRGYYVLRYGLQPQDGNHVGTFDTRDFLVLTPAKLDKDPQPIDAEQLNELGAESAGSTHPAIFPLLAPQKKNPTSPQVFHNAELEWTSVLLPAKSKEGKPLPIQLIVIGQAEE